MKYVNADSQERVWTTLTNPATGTTLGLQPGEVADLDLPKGFEDPFLKPVASSSPPAKSASKDKASVVPDTL